MAIQSSGAIALQDIEDEFGGAGSISLSEYYRNGTKVTSNNTSVPTSGTISLSNFYGATNQFTFNITSSTQNANIRTLAVNAGWDGSAPLIANVNAGIYLWSDSTSTGGAIIAGSFAGGLTLNNYGKIIGRGGDADQDGGPALTVASSGVAVVNASGAYIAGGGGGGGSSYSNTDSIHGGGGAGGGSGAGYQAGSGGAIGQAGSNGWATSSRDEGPGAPAGGGGSGGGSGGSISRNSGTTQAGGGGGGRILPGVGGTKSQHGGGDGGSAGAVGGTGGGGGWGAAGGGGGGAGGAAISGTSVSLTNNGTIYGTT